jgi:hypothetical protein
MSSNLNSIVNKIPHTLLEKTLNTHLAEELSGINLQLVIKENLFIARRLDKFSWEVKALDPSQTLSRKPILLELVPLPSDLVEIIITYSGNLLSFGNHGPTIY